jgi:hypothetical protein
MNKKVLVIILCIDQKMNENLTKMLNAYLRLIYKQESYSNVLILDIVMSFNHKKEENPMQKAQ